MKKKNQELQTTKNNEKVKYGDANNFPRKRDGFRRYNRAIDVLMSKVQTGSFALRCF